jgi:hypothetical protein
MKRAYWVGILALAGGITGYAFFRSIGWLGTGIGVVLGILLGAVLNSMRIGNRKYRLPASQLAFVAYGRRG